MDDLTQLWTCYTQQNDRQARETLILHYARLVKFVVGRLALTLPPSLQEEDLIGYGVLGLIEAIDRFDPARGVKFETFAVGRIRGQILDSLRHLDLLPRSARRQARELEQAMADLTQSLGRWPSDAEVASHLGLDLEQYYERLLNSNSTIISLDKPLAEQSDEALTLYDSVEDNHIPNPVALVDDKETKTELVRAIQTLPEREQVILSLYYNDGLTMKEIGQSIGISESRVSQMHARAVLALRSQIRNRAEPNLTRDDRRGISATVFAVAH
ncbi:MAG: FliA/WhiG family RNA polymerase sigma factor [Anaerolineae bacterium]|nr:FliA/WhiG family RNA polymerase sigma factor [Anaerolineae bacterium]